MTIIILDELDDDVLKAGGTINSRLSDLPCHYNYLRLPRSLLDAVYLSEKMSLLQPTTRGLPSSKQQQQSTTTS